MHLKRIKYFSEYCIIEDTKNLVNARPTLPYSIRFRIVTDSWFDFHPSANAAPRGRCPACTCLPRALCVRSNKRWPIDMAIASAHPPPRLPGPSFTDKHDLQPMYVAARPEVVFLFRLHFMFSKLHISLETREIRQRR